jgi:hypothetical protein
MSDSQGAKDEWPSAEQKAKNIAQAKALRVQAEKGGLRFSAYLPPGLADWLLGLIEKGTFHDPSEAVFVILGEHQDLEPHRPSARNTCSFTSGGNRRPAPEHTGRGSFQRAERIARVATGACSVGEMTGWVTTKRWWSSSGNSKMS